MDGVQRVPGSGHDASITPEQKKQIETILRNAEQHGLSVMQVQQQIAAVLDPARAKRVS
jgi:hypothetical protein